MTFIICHFPTHSQFTIWRLRGIDSRSKKEERLLDVYSIGQLIRVSIRGTEQRYVRRSSGKPRRAKSLASGRSPGVLELSGSLACSPALGAPNRLQPNRGWPLIVLAKRPIELRPRHYLLASNYPRWTWRRARVTTWRKPRFARTFRYSKRAV